jgi:hypothetical protein
MSALVNIWLLYPFGINFPIFEVETVFFNGSPPFRMVFRPSLKWVEASFRARPGITNHVKSFFRTIGNVTPAFDHIKKSTDVSNGLQLRLRWAKRLMISVEVCVMFDTLIELMELSFVKNIYEKLRQFFNRRIPFLDYSARVPLTPARQTIVDFAQVFLNPELYPTRKRTNLIPGGLNHPGPTVPPGSPTILHLGSLVRPANVGPVEAAPLAPELVFDIEFGITEGYVALLCNGMTLLLTSTTFGIRVS